MDSAGSEVAAALRRFERRTVERPDLKRAAVAIVLLAPRTAWRSC